MNKSIIGTVVSGALGNTVVVRVDRKIPHPLYRKLMARSKKFKAERGEVVIKVGDLVIISQTRPLSRDKHFKIKEVVTQGRKKE